MSKNKAVHMEYQLVVYTELFYLETRFVEQNMYTMFSLWQVLKCFTLEMYWYKCWHLPPKAENMDVSYTNNMMIIYLAVVYQ